MKLYDVMCSIETVTWLGMLMWWYTTGYNARFDNQPPLLMYKGLLLLVVWVVIVHLGIDVQLDGSTAFYFDS